MRVWLCIFAMLVVGCARHSPPRSQLQSVRYYPLLLPSSYGRTIGLEQFIEGSARGERFQLHSQIEIEAEQILVLGLTTFQTKAFVLRFDGKTVEFENFTDRRLPFPPEIILSDIQKILWPTLPDRKGWTIVEDPIAKLRLAFYDGQLVTRIQYQGLSPIDGNVELVDLQYGYQLHLKTLNVWTR